MTAVPIPFTPQSRFQLLRAATHRDDFAADVRIGLTAPQKWLPPRWFYDELGSSLFDAICFLPEYYVMRAEGEVLTTHTRDIARELGTNVRLVELGSGAARKTRILLDQLTVRQQDLEYVPVDVDASMIERVGRELLLAYPRIRVTGVVSDFARPSIPLAMLPAGSARTVVLFLGSTIGNLDPEAAHAMLRDLRDSLQPGDALFLGADLRKEKTILEPAYDDALGVTAAFNLNLLTRMNRELDAHFDIAAFRHLAFYDQELGRIEMHLVSQRAQRVRIGALDLDVDFAEGETIHTESSWKHDDATLAALAAGAGFTVARKWTDARNFFADVLLLAS
ncbi:MAG TPA: L-histidine N(alpha)-methyltransferase [Thermoanaerobaculia bacterium]|nr:L-histidine N(alpha)-methyltransferase [Thermoanaerobaculia bacterium]